ncbi:hypothetical protein ACTFIZ_008043 [Dictyostelium cf. discoideum]
MALWFEGTEIKIRLLYFLCIFIIIMGIISAFSTFIIGFILCVGSILIAGCGIAGARFNSHKLLFYFMCGLGILIILSFLSIIITAITDGWSWWMIKDFVFIAAYSSGIFLAFLLRGRSFRMNPSSTQNSNFQKL